MKITEQTINSIKEFIIPIIKKELLELVDINMSYQGGRLIFKILVDREEGGITLDECSRVNNIISERLDKEELISESFILEVSSPGVDRSLSSKEDFLRVKNRLIKVVLKEDLLGKKVLIGRLSNVSDNAILLDIDGELMEVPLINISYAVQKV